MRFRRLLPLCLLVLPLRLAAQAGDTLRAVELDRRDIFDPDERGFIARAANALHIQTRAVTIRRELLFGAGQPYDSALVAESERNLRALGVFRRVAIDTDAHAPGQLEWQVYGCDKAARHGIELDRIVNTMGPDELVDWAAAHAAG